jgi:hypothetical protein
MWYESPSHFAQPTSATNLSKPDAGGTEDEQFSSSSTPRNSNIGQRPFDKPLALIAF